MPGAYSWEIADQPMVERHDRRLALVALEQPADARHQAFVMAGNAFQLDNHRHAAVDQIERFLQRRQMVRWCRRS